MFNVQFKHANIELPEYNKPILLVDLCDGLNLQSTVAKLSQDNTLIIISGDESLSSVMLSELQTGNYLWCYVNELTRTENNRLDKEAN